MGAGAGGKRGRGQARALPPLLVLEARPAGGETQQAAPAGRSPRPRTRRAGGPGCCEPLRVGR